MPVKEPLYGLALRSHQNQFVHPVHRRDQLVWVGNVTSASDQSLQLLSDAKVHQVEKARTIPYPARQKRFFHMKARYKIVLARALNGIGSNNRPVDNIDWNTTYFFEVDIEYPRELHECGDDYPLAPVHFEITTEMLSKKEHAFRHK